MLRRVHITFNERYVIACSFLCPSSSALPAPRSILREVSAAISLRGLDGGGQHQMADARHRHEPRGSVRVVPVQERLECGVSVRTSIAVGQRKGRGSVSFHDAGVQLVAESAEVGRKISPAFVGVVHDILRRFLCGCRENRAIMSLSIVSAVGDVIARR